MSHRKSKDLAKAFSENKIGRRELMKRMGALGVGAAATSFMLNGVATDALAAGGPDFMKFKGKSIKLLLNKHPYVDAMLKNLGNFKQMTGLNVSYDIFPEDVYFDKVTTALASKSTGYDAFMTGAYQTWKYGPARQIEDLNTYLKDPKYTSEEYKWDDVIEGLRASTAWDGKAGSQLGGPGSKQWCIPWGFEMNSIAYNKKLFDAEGMTAPQNLPDLIEKAVKFSSAGKGVYGVGVRGSRSWATIHPGFLSAYTNYGQKDFVVKDGKLFPAMNTPESKAFHKMWVDMIRRAGPKNWPTYTWYEVGNDLGAGNSAMIYDADILGYFQNTGTKQAGNLAYVGFTPNPQAKAPTPNVWIWSLAMSSFSKMKEAAWYWIQWASGTQNTNFGATKADLVNPIRKSVWDNKEFTEGRLSKYPGYYEQYKASIDGARIYFTPQQLFPEFTTDWAAMLQQMYANQIPVDEGLDKLATSLEKKLRDVGL